MFYVLFCTIGKFSTMTICSVRYYFLCTVYGVSVYKYSHVIFILLTFQSDSLRIFVFFFLRIICFLSPALSSNSFSIFSTTAHLYEYEYLFVHIQSARTHTYREGNERKRNKLTHMHTTACTESYIKFRVRSCVSILNV